MLQKVLLGPKLAVCLRKRSNLLISQCLIAGSMSLYVLACNEDTVVLLFMTVDT